MFYGKFLLLTCILLSLILSPGKGQKVKGPLNISKSPDTIFHEVTRSPAFPGGRKGLVSYIHSEVNYPENALKDSLEGVMTAKFMVSKKGSIRRIRIVDSLCPSVHKQVKKALQKMPRWKPGYKNGEAVNTWIYLPLRFRLLKE